MHYEFVVHRIFLHDWTMTWIFDQTSVASTHATTVHSKTHEASSARHEFATQDTSISPIYMGTCTSHLCAHPTPQLKLRSLYALCRLCVGTMIRIRVIVTTTHLCLPLFLPSPLRLHALDVDVSVSLAAWFTGIIMPERTSSSITTSARTPCIHPTCFAEDNNYIHVLLCFALTMSFIL
jgi:hypothetical protein